MKKLDGSLFTADNYSAFGSPEGLLMQGRYDKIVGYTDNPSFHHFKDDCGVMFINNFGKEVWTDVSRSFLENSLLKNDIRSADL